MKVKQFGSSLSFIYDMHDTSSTFSTSYVVCARGLVGELLLFNANKGTVDGVVDVWQVCLGWTLSDSSELVVHGTVAKAHPSLVGTKIWHWDATQVSANG